MERAYSPEICRTRPVCVDLDDVRVVSLDAVQRPFRQIRCCGYFRFRYPRRIVVDQLPVSSHDAEIWLVDAVVQKFGSSAPFKIDLTLTSIGSRTSL